MLGSAPVSMLFALGMRRHRGPPPIGGGRMIRQTLGCVAVAAWLLASGQVLAHHSLAGTYDIKSEGKVTGKLVKVAFTNPHGAMTITYFAARNGKPIGFIRSITLPDKREVTLSNGGSND